MKRSQRMTEVARLAMLRRMRRDQIEPALLRARSARTPPLPYFSIGLGSPDRPGAQIVEYRLFSGSGKLVATMKPGDSGWRFLNSAVNSPAPDLS